MKPMHRILVRPTVQLQYGTARFFVEEISKKLGSLFDFFEKIHAKNDFETRETNFVIGKNDFTGKQKQAEETFEESRIQSPPISYHINDQKCWYTILLFTFNSY